jgi:Flp pilus assembly protein TadG
MKRTEHAGLTGLLRSRRGAVSPIMALWLIPLVGLMGLATETAGWFYTQRAAQNAADSAVMAAATNACAATQPCHTTALQPTYDQEAKAVAAKFGFATTSTGVTITTTNTDPCPGSGLAQCYRVTITKAMPVNLLRVVGFAGTSQDVSASSWASPAGGARTYCVLAVGTTGVTVSNNSPNIPPAFCHIMQNSTANPASSCPGNKYVADIIDAAGDPGPTCAPNHNASVAAVSTSSYSSKASLIPADPCGGVYNGTSISGPTVWGANAHSCGTLKVLANATITTPASGTLLTIYNGDLSLHPSNPVSTNLTTASGSGLTIVLSGNKAGASHTIVFGGPSVLDVAAPTTGSWAGIALYQDPSANGPTTGVDQSMSPANGGGSAWKVTGLIYMPNANVTLSGGVVKSTAGQACFSLVAKSFAASGNYSIYSDSQSNCGGAGLTPPTSSVGGTRQSLVK